MKKRLLLLPLFLLVSCGNRTLNKMYILNNVNDDSYIYSCSLDYDTGRLLLNRYKTSDKIDEYKSYSLGNYEIITDKNNPRFYDYGDYGIWVRI